MKKVIFSGAVLAFLLVSPLSFAAGATTLTWERSQMQQVEVDPLIAQDLDHLDLIGQGETLPFSTAGNTSDGRFIYRVLIPTSFNLGIYSVHAVLKNGTFKDFATIRIVEYQSAAYSPLTDTATITTLSVTLFTLLAVWGLSDEPARRKEDEYSDDQTTFDGADGGELGRGASDSRSHRKGLISSTYLDQLRSVATITSNRFSPLTSRLIADSGYLQFSLGALVLLLPIIGGLLGALAFQDISGIGSISTPSLTISLAIIILGSFDAGAGFIAAAVFGLCALSSDRFGNVYDVRTFMGLAILWFTPSFIANSTRALRKSRKDSNLWERITDIAVGSLITGWAVRSIVLALDGFAHLQLPLTKHSTTIGITAGVCVAIRYLIEGYVNQKNHYYMAYLSPRSLNQQSSNFRLVSWFTKAFIFLFFAVSFLGVTWQIWVALFIVIFPNMIKLIKDRFPNSSTLFQIIPIGVPAMVIMTLIGRAYSEFINGLELDPATASKTIFVLASLPGFTLGLLKLIGRSPKSGDTRWYMREKMTALYRTGGVLMLLTYAGLTIGFLG